MYNIHGSFPLMDSVSPPTTCTSSYLPLFSFCSISQVTKHSRKPSTRKQFQRLHSTLARASLDVEFSQVLYERSRTSSNGHIPGNLCSAMGAGRFKSAMCVMVGGRERTTEIDMGADIRIKVHSDGGMGLSESQSDKSCEELPSDLLLSRMKKSSRRVACGPTISNSPFAWPSCEYIGYNFDGGRGAWMAAYLIKSQQR